jgi:hypothetical protein
MCFTNLMPSDEGMMPQLALAIQQGDARDHFVEARRRRNRQAALM